MSKPLRTLAQRTGQHGNRKTNRVFDNCGDPDNVFWYVVVVILLQKYQLENTNNDNILCHYGRSIYIIVHIDLFVKIFNVLKYQYSYLNL